MPKKQSIENKHRSFSLFKRFRKRKIALKVAMCFLVIFCLHTNIGDNIISNARFFLIDARFKINKYIDDIRGQMVNMWYLLSCDIDVKLLKLQKENITFQEKIEILQKLKSENDELRALLHMSKNYEQKIIVGKVVTIFSSDFAKSCILDIGEKDGVELDDIVKNSSGLLGRIIEVNNKWSRVLLIVDANSSIPVKIGPNQINAILTGTNSDRMKLSMIHEDVTINDGDYVETSGYGNIFPEKIVVGKVKKYKDDLCIVPVVNFQIIHYVSVIKKQSHAAS